MGLGDLQPLERHGSWRTWLMATQRGEALSAFSGEREGRGRHNPSLGEERGRMLAGSATIHPAGVCGRCCRKLFDWAGTLVNMLAPPSRSSAIAQAGPALRRFRLNVPRAVATYTTEAPRAAAGDACPAAFLYRTMIET